MSLALSKTPNAGLFCVEALIYYFGPCFYSYSQQRLDVLRNSKLVSGRE